MLLTLLFVASFSLLCLAGNNEQTNMMTKVDLLKSIIYDNTKATVTLDSTALKQLIQLFADSSNSAQRISFSVFLNSRHVITLGARQTVKYDRILTNDGNGYDDRTGVFTCPLAGTYMFVVDSLSFPGTCLDLKVNKNKVGRLHVSSAHKGNPIIQISRTIIVKLKTGDHVKVENEHNRGTIHPTMYSGFTGVRMY
ncbi:complement C1q subcomponent subunit B-like [Crassostrea angulata]|uniref:complement C1q subcomponent subunit B-like n=1 Tax=Magallana angulata TaxID=2784310 RepID=UPI0022B1289F|nr:complement C1q subcomponent subunit B-like [Crassostrea angulata]